MNEWERAEAGSMYAVKIPGTKESRVQVQEPKTLISAGRDAPWLPAEIRGGEEMKLSYSLCQLAIRSSAYGKLCSRLDVANKAR